jgi:uncharacterized phage-associated protein
VADIFDVANWFLYKEPMSHKKLQKLCYYAQAWSFALRDKPIADADFRAWAYGPVSPELFSKYKVNGVSDLYPDDNVSDNFTADELEILKSVWETYGESTGNSLEVLSHGELPWINARNGYQSGDVGNNSILPDDMKKFYRTIYTGNLVQYA